MFRALALDNGGAAVLAVTGVRSAPAHDQQTLADRALQQARSQGIDDAMAYADEVRRTATVRKNPKTFD